MKKTYCAPDLASVNFDTEEILNISFTGTGTVLGDSDDNKSSKNPASDFGGVTLF